MKHRDNLELLLKYQNLEMIKLITGVRRSGKSFLLKLFKEHLAMTGVKTECIAYYNFENLEYAGLLDAMSLYEDLKKKYLHQQEQIYYLFDEMQFVEDWQKVVNSLHANGNCDIYVTGSNATMLSGELATHLTGRYIQIEMTPLSYSEYLEFASVDKGGIYDSTHLDTYMQYGGFPLAALQQDEDVKNAILSGIYGDIILRDVALRGEITDLNLLARVVHFLMDNIGQPISTTNIANTLKSSGHAVSPTTIGKIIHLLKDAYLFYECSRFDIRGRNRLRNTPKYYIVDLGLRNNELGSFSRNYGSQLENMVFLELFRRGYEVYTGKLGDREIDFWAVRGDEKYYIQVALRLPNNAHETDNLLFIKDNYKKIVITYDLGSVGEVNGIPIVHIEQFLLKELKKL